MSITSTAEVINSHAVTLKGYAKVTAAEFGSSGRVGFAYSETDKNPLRDTSKRHEESPYSKTDGSYSQTIDNLKPGTTYYYRAYCTKNGEYVHATEVKTFRTKDVFKEAVDLGLPSGTKWASTNIGAMIPEAVGNYYAWGETTSKNTYDWASYRWCKGSEKTLTKYCSSSTYGTVDNKKVLDLTDDAARATWGGTWRMPTKAEYDELVTNCTWVWTTLNGVYGYKVSSTKNKVNYIFLPRGYYMDGSKQSANANGATTDARYWTSSAYNGSQAYFLECMATYSYHECTTGDRRLGCFVRAVCN